MTLILTTDKASVGVALVTGEGKRGTGVLR